MSLIRENIIGLILIFITFASLFLGGHSLSFLNNTNEPIIQQFEVVVSILFFIFGLIFFFITIRYIHENDLFVLNIERNHEKYVEEVSNYVPFVVTLLCLLIILYLIGIMVFSNNKSYWALFDGFVAVSGAMIVSYVPWFERLKNIIYSTSWERLFLIMAITFLFLLVIFAYFMVIY